MKPRLIFFLKYYIYWICLSIFTRIVFLIYQWKETIELGGIDLVRVFTNGLYHDLSIGAYVMLLVSLIIVASSVIKAPLIRRLLTYINAVLITVFFIVNIINLEIFSAWGFHMDTTPIKYLTTPKEAFASTPVAILVLGVVLLIGFSVFFQYIFVKYIVRNLQYRRIKLLAIPTFLIIGGLMIIPVRGGLNVAPMNASFVFFHPSSMYANQAAINPMWNFVYELTHMDEAGKGQIFMDENKKEEIIKEIKQESDTTLNVLNTLRPNIVFLLMESFTANAIEIVGGKKGVTPTLNLLKKESIVFNNIYASSFRSDRGLVASVSGLPASPYYAIIDSPSKLMKYPSFPKKLEKEGYHTRFYYAGDLNFGNFSSYTRMNFMDLVTEKDFTGEAIKNRFKWGVHDEYMYERLYSDIKEAKQPFMYTAFNMSSHEPFAVPMEKKFSEKEIENKFYNAIYYTDKHLGIFFDNCKKSGVWDNTLFIVMADHGTRSIGSYEAHRYEAYHIPLILTGGALAVKDTVISTIGSQTDMIASVLSQMQINCKDFAYSRNLLANGAKDFAFYSNSTSAAVITNKERSIYHLKSKRFIEGGKDKENVLSLEAYLQEITTTLGK